MKQCRLNVLFLISIDADEGKISFEGQIKNFSFRKSREKLFKYIYIYLSKGEV